MFMMKYLTSSYKSENKFFLNNFGHHTRDFTYIKDVCEILKKLIFSKKKIKHEIFNICSNNPIDLYEITKKINLITEKKPKLYKRKLQKADVVKTHGQNNKILQFIKGYKFTSIDQGLLNKLQWFKKYYNF